ncbi:MAG TPA: response regulator [Bryobacteraceae bacterium]|jgi:CheY-like chemotaxis protein
MIDELIRLAGSVAHTSPAVPAASVADAVVEARANIVVVDDQPANLKLIGELLGREGYAVRLFPRGRLALAAVEQALPDLILLDINMPEMNGYEVCAQLKNDTRLAGIPVIFLSALDAVEDKVKGFHAGGVDYISKPFQFEEVQARVETHVKLRRAQQAERDLLEKTLGGAVGTLWELIQLTSPVFAMRSRAIREIVQRVAKHTGVADSWQCEIAATLCLVGCLTLPEKVFEKAWRGELLAVEEDRMFLAHPETGARLIAKIPRLDLVAELIRRQEKPATDLSLTGSFRQSTRVLSLAVELDRRIFRGVTPVAALADMRRSRRFESAMLDALEGYSPREGKCEVRKLRIRDLRAGLVLDKDVLGMNGKLLILKEGTVLTDTWIERLENFARVQDGQEIVEVRVSVVQ